MMLPLLAEQLFVGQTLQYIRASLNKASCMGQCLRNSPTEKALQNHDLKRQ
jgi:hypothetical protein